MINAQLVNPFKLAQKCPRSWLSICLTSSVLFGLGQTSVRLLPDATPGQHAQRLIVTVRRISAENGRASSVISVAAGLLLSLSRPADPNKQIPSTTRCCALIYFSMHFQFNLLRHCIDPPAQICPSQYILFY